MANKREFKKYVDAVGANACESMMVTFHNVEGLEPKLVNDAITQVLSAVAAARSHANVFFDKGHKAFGSMEEYSKEKKAFFKKLFVKVNDDFAKELDAALKTFNSSIPQQVKDANKAASAE